jgi:ammonia channel protein AmtB
MQAAAAASVLTWVSLDCLQGKPSVIGACYGVLAGLVAVSPAATFVSPMSSILIGFLGAISCRCGCNLFPLHCTAHCVSLSPIRHLVLLCRVCSSFCSRQFT